MKKLSNLKGAKALNKQEQKNINGGGLPCPGPCPAGCRCVRNGICVQINDWSKICLEV